MRVTKLIELAKASKGKVRVYFNEDQDCWYLSNLHVRIIVVEAYKIDKVRSYVGRVIHDQEDIRMSVQEAAKALGLKEKTKCS